MDTRQIEYILMIADEKSMTRAARKLFITQSALSQQLQKLEKELDTQLFIRSRSEWIPTPEGEIYLKNAREILWIKRQTYSYIADMVRSNKNYLSIGITPNRGPDMFTHVYPLFHQQYPQVTVEPRELSVKRQQEEIRKGNLDLGFMTLTDEQRSIDTYTELLEEELYIGVPEGYDLTTAFTKPNERPSDEQGFYPELDLKSLQHEPFVLMYKESTMRVIADQIFQDAHFVPNVLFETSSIHTMLSMIQAKLCIGLIPYHYIKHKPAGIKFYRIPSHPRWKVCACYRKDAYVSHSIKTFLELAKAYWNH